MNEVTFELTDAQADELKSLVQLDIDASLAYAKAIEGIDAEHSEIKTKLESFKADHERHILELSNALAGTGYDPPEYKRDMKGVLIEGMTAVRAALGTRQALKAMRQNELLTNAKYKKAALELTALPTPIVEIISRAREDERVHLAYVEQALEELERDASEART